MTGISERQSLTREEKFVALAHIYAELRLPFDAALDAAEADLSREQNEGPKEAARRSGDDPLTGVTLSPVQKWWASTAAFCGGMRSRTRFVRVDAEKAEFPPESFDVIWSMSDPNNAASAGPAFTPPVTCATAVPTSTGTSATVSVAGRAASTHARAEPASGRATASSS